MSMPPPPPPGQGFPPPGDGSGSRPPGAAPPPPGSQPPGYGQPPPPGYGTLPPAAPPPGAPPPGPYGGGPSGSNDTPKILGIVSIALGIIGVPAACCCWPVGLVIAVAGLVCAGIGWSQMQGQPQQEAKPFLIAGFVLSGVVILLVVLSFVFGMASAFSGYNDF